MTPNASRAVWSATRNCWIALHRESGGRLLLIRADTKERASETHGESTVDWISETTESHPTKE